MNYFLKYSKGLFSSFSKRNQLITLFRIIIKSISEKRLRYNNILYSILRVFNAQT